MARTAAVLGFALMAVLPGLAIAQDTPAAPAPLRDCAGKDACPYSIDFTAAQAVERLKDERLAYWIDADMIRIAARGDAETVRLCCTFQTKMTLLGQDDKGKVWGAAWRVPAIDQSIITLTLPGMDDAPYLVHRGAHAPPAPEAAEVLQGTITEIAVDSVHLKAKRALKIYTPKAPAPATGYPVVYVADGLNVGGYARIVDKLIADGVIKPVLLVGIAAGDGPALPGETYDLRGREYLPTPYAISADYLRHEAFVRDEVMPLAERRYHASTRPEDRMTTGYSNGAGWALSFALRHRDDFRHVGAFSIGMSPDHFDFSGKGELNLYLQAGRFEEIFLKQTQAACRKAISHGVKCGVMALYAGHDSHAWLYAFSETMKTVYRK